jgi:hypothetical protein
LKVTWFEDFQDASLEYLMVLSKEDPDDALATYDALKPARRTVHIGPGGLVAVLSPVAGKWRLIETTLRG